MFLLTVFLLELIYFIKSGPQVADRARRRPEGDGLPPQVFAFAQQLQPRREGRRQERGDQERVWRGHGRADKSLFLTGYWLRHKKILSKFLITILNLLRLLKVRKVLHKDRRTFHLIFFSSFVSYAMYLYNKGFIHKFGST